LISGKIERNAKMSGSICDAIISPQPGEITFPINKRLCGPGLIVTEDECLHAMALIWARLKLVAEPGGAAAVAAALFRKDQIEGDTVIATISGGNVDTDMFQTALNKYGDQI
jgi:threonine dehydratase